MQTPINAYTPGPKLDSTRSLLIAMKEKGTLQSYVAQHKNSPEYPYLLALAASIDQVSNAAKAAEHQPAPQTVADQKLASLAPSSAPAMSTMQLPEDVGIGRLPAPNLKKLAGGGIVAFDEGGEVEHYADKGFTGYNPTAVFSDALRGLFEREGGRTVDSGGLTKYGISQKTYKDLDIDNLTMNDAAKIYKRDYWDANKLDRIARKDPKLAAAMFDTFVNHPPAFAKKALEESGGDVNKLIDLRKNEYDRLTTEDPKKYGQYAEGWNKRLYHLSNSIAGMGDRVDNLPDFDVGSTAQAKEQFPVQEKTSARGAAKIPITGLAAANAAATAAPVLLDKFAPAIVNDPKALANAMRATGATGAGIGALGATGAALSSGAANLLRNTTSRDQRQAIADNPMLSAMSGDTGFAGAIMNAGQDEYRPDPNASSYWDQMANVGKFFLSHPDVRKGAQQEAAAAAAKAPKKPKQEQYDWKAFDSATEQYMADRDMRKAADALKPKADDKKVVPEEKTQTAQSGISGLFNDPAFLMGLNLMSGKSPYALQNVGEAGLATAAAMQNQQKLAIEREAKQAEAQYRRSVGRQAEAYADAIERGAKEKNLELEAEKLVQQRLKDWGSSMEGKLAKPEIAAAKEAQIRQTIYQYLGISPTMMPSSAPAVNTSNFKMLGVR